MSRRKKPSHDCKDHPIRYIDGQRWICGICGALLRQRHIEHGRTKTPEYRTWVGMKARCMYPSNKSYENYGGRGIKVCDRWLSSFMNFYNDMGPRPEGCSIDRINKNGNYTPENCRWATRSQQNANRREWSKLYKMLP